MLRHFVCSWLISIGLIFSVNQFQLSEAHAQTLPISGEIELIAEDASAEALATETASLASPAAEVIEKIQEKKDSDITDTAGKQKSELALFLDQNPPDSLSWNNFLQHTIREAVADGMPANTIVIMLLFPLVAAIIAASRHIIGLRGFGIYIPAVLAVALVSIGLIEGLIIFSVIVVTALLAKKVLSKTSMPYLPRTSLVLWTVSVSILIVLMIAPLFNITNLLSTNVFPILILILLAENFLDAQSKSKESMALALTIETIALAVISGLIVSWTPIQKFALIQPELFLLAVAVFSVAVGKFAGLRVSERFRFRPIIEEE